MKLIIAYAICGCLTAMIAIIEKYYKGEFDPRNADEDDEEHTEYDRPYKESNSKCFTDTIYSIRIGNFRSRFSNLSRSFSNPREQ